MMVKIVCSANRVFESTGNLSHCHTYNISTDRYPNLMRLL